jgi:hypothetical protein
LCNRFEALLRAVDPDLSLHYWDWTTDPRNSSGVNLFSSTFMGSASGAVGAPFAGLGAITRNVNGGVAGAPAVNADAITIGTADGLPHADQYAAFRAVVEGDHDGVHGYIGGTIGDAHTSFEDPFVFLLHSNVDRLLAMWQTQPGQEWRLDPTQVYGGESMTGGVNGITTPMEPWAGITTAVRPWAPPENQQVYKTSTHASVVRPPCYDTLPVVVDLTTPVMGAPLSFHAVPEGATTVRAAVFAVRACFPIHLEVVSGPGAGFSVVQAMPVTVTPGANLMAEGRVWLAYTGSTAGAIANGSVTIRCIETGQEWIIPITADTVAWPTSASMLVLDKSGSMEWDSGIPSFRRVDVLRFAAPVFVDMLPDNDAIGIVSFDHDPSPVMPVTVAGPPVIGMGRINAKAAINAHTPNPLGGTSIGDGVELGHNTLSPVTGFDHKAMVVLTDGHETAAKYLSDPSLTGLINDRVYAIGLGKAEQLNPAALSSLANSTGGFLMMTGDLGVNDIFRLSKYYLQILAGVTNAQIVVDPEGSVLPNQVHRIPFWLTESDFRGDVILLSPAPWAFDFVLETPDGDILDASSGGVLPGVSFIRGDRVHYYRMTLPVAIGRGAREGLWHALLRVGDGNFKAYLTTLRRNEDRRVLQRAQAHGVPYSVSIHARSNLHMPVSVAQNSYQPGTRLTLRAQLTEYDQMSVLGGRVTVQVGWPDGTNSVLALTEYEPGRFEGALTAALAGVYYLTFRGEGKTLRGLPFTREEVRTAAVWKGGDNPPPSSQSDPHERDEQLCRLLECLLSKETLGRFYEQFGIDAEMVMKCLQVFCAERLAPAAEGRQPRLRDISPVINRELEEMLGQTKASELVALLAEVMNKAR